MRGSGLLVTLLIGCASARVPPPRTISPATLTGRVATSDGRPVSGLRVFAASNDAAAFRALEDLDCPCEERADALSAVIARVRGERRVLSVATTDESGVFRVEASDGVALTLSVEDGDGGVAIEQVPHPSSEVTLTLDRGIAIEGTVRLEGGQSPVQANVVVTSRAGFFAEVKPDANGRFRVWPVPSGEYWVLATSEGLFSDYAVTRGNGVCQLTLYRPRSLAGFIYEGSRLIVGAKVELSRGKTPFLAISDAAGAFQFSGVRPGQYEVQTQVEGKYGSEMASVPYQSEPTAPLRLQLGTPRWVEFRLRDERAQPVAGVRVQLMADRWFRRFGTSDSDGVVRIGPLPPGTFRASVYPLHHLEPRSQEAELSRGDQVLEFVLHPAAPLSGKILDAFGKPVAGAQILAAREGETRNPDQGTGVGLVDSRHDGSFEVTNLTPGPHHLTITHPEQSPLMTTVTVPATDLTLSFPRQAMLLGRLVDASGKPRSGVPIALLAVEEIPNEPSAVSDESGEFRLHAVPGRYRIEAGQRPGHHRSGRSLSIAPREVLVDPARNPLLAIKLLEDRSIEGRVIDLDGVPVSDAQVFARAEADGALLRAATGADGSFLFEFMTGGGYRLSAERQGYSIEPLDQVEAGSRDVIMKARVERLVQGRVVDDNHQPVGAFVLNFTQFRDPRGTFSLTPRKSGKVSLLVRALGFASAVREIDVQTGRITSVGDIVLERGRIIRGTITDLAGHGVAGASIRLGEGRMAPIDAVTSSSSGAFVLAGVPSDKTTLHVMHPRFIPIDRPLPPSEDEVSIKLDGGARIQGTLRKTKGGAPVPGVAVFVRPPGRDEVRAVTDANGAFELAGLKAGSVIVRTYVPGKSNPWSDWKYVRLLSGGVAVIELFDDLPGAELRVRLEEGSDQGELSLAAGIPADPRSYSELQSLTLGLWGEPSYRMLRPVPPGTYTLFLSSFSGGFRVARKVIKVDSRAVQEVLVKLRLPPASATSPDDSVEIME